MQTEKVEFFVKDPHVSSCILAIVSMSTKSYSRTVNACRPTKVIGIAAYKEVEKKYVRTTFTCICGSNGKASKRYVYTNLPVLSDVDFVKLFRKQCPAFQKMFAEKYRIESLKIGI